jgi:hypothetical protein
MASEGCRNSACPDISNLRDCDCWERLIVKRLCANGCDKPIAPPSKVICRDCQNRITRNLENAVKGDWNSREEAGE